MNNLEDLEKKINSELTTKINNTNIKHGQLSVSYTHLRAHEK